MPPSPTNSRGGKSAARHNAFNGNSTTKSPNSNVKSNELRENCPKTPEIANQLDSPQSTASGWTVWDSNVLSVASSMSTMTVDSSVDMWDPPPSTTFIDNAPTTQPKPRKTEAPKLELRDTENVDDSLFIEFCIQDPLPSPLYAPYCNWADYNPPAPFDSQLCTAETRSTLGSAKINILATRSSVVIDRWILNRRHLLFAEEVAKTPIATKPSNPWEQASTLNARAVRAVEKIEAPFIGFDCEWAPQWQKGQPPNPVGTIQLAVRRAPQGKQESDIDVLIVSIDPKHAEKLRIGQPTDNPITENLLALFRNPKSYKLGVGIFNDIDYMGAGILQLGLLSQQQWDRLNGDIGHIMHGSIDMSKLVLHDWERWRNKLGRFEWNDIQLRLSREALARKPPSKSPKPNQSKHGDSGQQEQFASFGPPSGLAALVTRYLSLPPKPDGTTHEPAVLPKTKKLKLCDWSNWPLTKDQLTYAAMDAVAAIKVWECMCKDMENKWNIPMDEAIRRGRRSHATTMVIARSSSEELIDIDVNEIVRSEVSILVVRKRLHNQLASNAKQRQGYGRKWDEY